MSSPTWIVSQDFLLNHQIDFDKQHLRQEFYLICQNSKLKTQKKKNKQTNKKNHAQGAIEQCIHDAMACKFYSSFHPSGVHQMSTRNFWKLCDKKETASS